MQFQTCWPRESSWGAHATYSGDRTICGLSVYTALPVYLSHPEDVACNECRASLLEAKRNEEN